jgi:hypothetical protein
MTAKSAKATPPPLGGKPQWIKDDEQPQTRQPAFLKNTALLERVAKVVGDVTAEQVGAIMAAYWAIFDGDPVGTIRRDPDTGAVAVRVEDNGMNLWRVNGPDGEQYNDLQPTLPWPVLG